MLQLFFLQVYYSCLEGRHKLVATTGVGLAAADMLLAAQDSELKFQNGMAFQLLAWKTLHSKEPLSAPLGWCESLLHGKMHGAFFMQTLVQSSTSA